MKLILNEDLFEDAPIPSVELENPITVDEEEIAPQAGPEEGADTGVSDVLMNLIKDEYDAIQGYNSFLATIKGIGGYEDMIPVIEHITAEEQKHVGELTTLLEKVSPNTAKQEEGKAEADTEMKEGE